MTPCLWSHHLEQTVTADFTFRQQADLTDARPRNLSLMVTFAPSPGPSLPIFGDERVNNADVHRNLQAGFCAYSDDSLRTCVFMGRKWDGQ